MDENSLSARLASKVSYLWSITQRIPSTVIPAWLLSRYPTPSRRIAEVGDESGMDQALAAHSRKRRASKW